MSSQTSSSAAGPSRIPYKQDSTMAPSTSGDSETTNRPVHEKGLDVGILRDLAKASLVEQLNDIPGQKTLVLDPSLAGPLGLVTEVAALKSVEKMFWLESGPLSVSTRNVVWLCRPKLRFMRIIADQIRSQQSSQSTSGPLTYTILLVPRATELCRKVLEDEGVAGDVNVAQYKLEFLPVEEDLLSLELDDVARDIYLNGDDTPILYSSLALMTFQRAFGLIPRIVGKGDAAKRLADQLQRHHKSGAPEYAEIEPSEHVDSLIIIDRSIDWVTPMCTQLTYEGMLDEFMGIKNGHIEIDPSLLDPQAPTGLQAKKKKHLLSSKDRLFSDIRDLNFAVVGSRLSKLARRLEGDYGGAKNLKNVREMKEFVGKLGGLQGEQQNLRLHTGLTEQLMPITRQVEFNKSLEAQQNLVAGYEAAAQLSTIEDLLYQHTSWTTVLRGAVLASVTNGGVKPKVLEAFKRDFLQAYGYHHIPLFIALEKLNLLSSTTAPAYPFPTLRKSLRLIVDDVDDATPNDVSYVYSGYAPISIRLVQCVAQKNAIMATAPTPRQNGQAEEASGRSRILPQAHSITGWRGFEDVVAGIPGATVDIRQKSESGVPERSPDKTVTTVVFFLGGCTFAELAALRWMSRQTKGRRFLVATTGIINGSTLLESLGDKQPVALKA